MIPRVAAFVVLNPRDRFSVTSVGDLASLFRGFCFNFFLPLLTHFTRVLKLYRYRIAFYLYVPAYQVHSSNYNTAVHGP